MTEQEAQAEALAEWDRRNIDQFVPSPIAGGMRYSFNSGWIARAAWEQSRAEAAPSDTDRGTFTASNGYKVDRLADGQTKITRATVGSFEHVTWCGGDEYLAIAEHALSRVSQPVQVEVTDDMVEKAAEAFGGLTATNWSGAQEWEREVVRGSMRAALSAALGGGDHAE